MGSQEIRSLPLQTEDRTGLLQAEPPVLICCPSLCEEVHGSSFWISETLEAGLARVRDDQVQIRAGARCWCWCLMLGRWQVSW